MFGEADRHKAVFPREPTAADAQTLLELYKIAIKMADKNSERRHATNNFFLGLNTALLAVVGYFISKERNPPTELHFLILPAGIVLCSLWFGLLESYRKLGTAKFAVIHEIESSLPARLYSAEWTLVGEGEDPKKYRPFTHIERFVPWIFAAMYGIALVYVLMT